ncbi:WXG100 family type VII secretion target [Streptomyces sp. NPDC013178]|uniref:WXG100 family type VII secretion target n=1 Tax=Streptomyces sp. NPDC013178 TaxID=3155118 RepID=UPI0033E77FF7
MGAEDTPIHVTMALEVAGIHLNNKAQEITDALHNLRARLQPLIDVWVAQSATNYQMHMHQWDVAAVGLFGGEDVDGVLGEIAHALNINWGNYVSAEEANIKTWNSTHSLSNNTASNW